MKKSARHLQAIERRFSPLMRTLVVLLCALYVVAPLWHVCEMSGSHCEHEKPQSSTRFEICAAPDEDSAHHDDEPCRCPDHERAEKQRVSSEFSSVKVSSSDAAFNGTCLARLLSVTPSQISTSFAFTPLFTARTFVAPRVFFALSVSSLPQPPVRGPPFSA